MNLRERRSKSRSRSRSHSVEKDLKQSKSRSRRSRSKDRRRSRSRDRRDRTKRSRSRERKRSKSRERKDRKRSRSRSRDRKDRSKRSRSRDRKRSRSRDRKKSKKSKSRSRSKSRDDPKVFDPTVLDKEEAEKQLEAEMRKRRERIEKWRAEKKKKEIEMTKREAEKGTITVPKGSAKAWNLEDDEDEEDGAGEKKDNADDEVDPLDAFMTGIQEEVRRINRAGKPSTTIHSKKADTLVTPPAPAVTTQPDAVPQPPPLPPATTTTTDAATTTITNTVKNGTGELEVPAVKPVIVTGVASTVKKPVIITGVANKKSRKKGELMEQNQDGLEYSSEEEGEDLKDTMLSIAKKGRKELAKVDHGTVEYVPFRKDFYIEVPEIASMSKEEVETYREELEGIKVKGVGCPRPIKSWPQCGVSKRTLDVLKKCKYEKPTPIQAQAIPAIMSGRDVIGIAKTGSGKTLAFLLPLIRHVVDQPPLLDTDGPIAIIMTPTRELAMQIGRECRKFCRSSLRIAVVYGGTGISEQIAELKRGAEIIVCTPGRMIDMLAANNGRVTNLKRVSYIVLDEADRMFDLGFEPQVMRIIENVQPERQTVMFSATFPRQVEALAKKILQKPIEIMVGGRSVVCKDVSQHVVILEEDDKFLKLLELLGQFYELGQTIIFVDKQESADSLYKDLLSHSYRAMVLHGGVDQIDRDTNIMDFKAGRVPVLVATSVAARGLDVKQLVLVVNFDAPNHYEDYVHRCGRTGRAGNKGHAYTFLSPDQPRYAGNIIRAMEMSETPVPQELHDLWNAYKARMESEGKKVKTGGGFHGRGFKFDDEEANFATEKKKFQKAALGLQDSDDEDIEGDIEQHIIKLLNTKRTVKEVKPTPLISPALLASIGGGPGTLGGTLLNMQASASAAAATAASKLELAKRLAQKFNAQHGAGGHESTVKGASQQAAEFVMKGGTSMMQPAISAKTVAEQMAQKLNNRLNYQPSGDLDDEDNPNSSMAEESYQKYEEELEINDFPQQARWRVTSKEALAQISEYSEAGITVRGTFCPASKNPPEGERKLFLAIESTSELAVSKAKAEIIRLIREELVKLRTSGGGLKSQGRYKVL
ncbi:probable ATP-dependent RNA helicase DDX46 [Hyalella azteca]|uniref:Probable ATP-dependent RNA helicase DDX46 n=1 Tax=Hyalella azteca TaxID=294128 RepID=A0A8B7NFL2_HYAAZ|nr:probable ATP-dependent RNA helicase DDX46 [Hyalella azteca]